MSTREILIAVGKGGEVYLQVVGGHGPSCAQDILPYVQALGAEVVVTELPEFHAEVAPVVAEQEVVEGSVS